MMSMECLGARTSLEAAVGSEGSLEDPSAGDAISLEAQEEGRARTPARARRDPAQESHPLQQDGLHEAK